MAKISRLFDLIGSLTAHEKRYFRLFSNIQSGEKSYLKLFDELDKQKEYDPTKIKLKFKGEKFVKNLAVTQSYLCEQILKSLRNINAGKKQEKRVFNLLNEFNFLLEKGLHEHADSILKKAKKIAEENDFHQLQSLILIKEIGSKNTRVGRRKKLRELYELSREIGFLAEKELSLYAYKNHYFAEIVMPQISGETEKELDSKWVLIQKEVGDPDALSFITKREFLEIQRLRAGASKDYMAQYQISKDIYGLWMTNLNRKENNEKIFLIDVGNYLRSCFRLKKYEELKLLFKELPKSAPEKNLESEAEFFKTVRFREILYYLNTSKFKAAKKAMPSIESEFHRFERYIHTPRKISFFYNNALVYFFSNDPKIASDWIDKIIAMETSEFELKVRRFAHFFNLILHFEMNLKSGNLNYLHSVIAQIERRFNSGDESSGIKKGAEFSNFERTILKFVKEYIDSGLGSRRAILKEFYDKVKEIRKSQMNLTGSEEIEMWLKQKLGLK